MTTDLLTAAELFHLRVGLIPAAIVAKALGLSKGTVQIHRKNVRDKLMARFTEEFRLVVNARKIAFALIFQVALLVGEITREESQQEIQIIYGKYLYKIII